MQSRKKILISGATGALGSALARAFAAQYGCELALFYRSNKTGIVELEKACQSSGARNVFSVCADIGDAQAVGRGFVDVDKKIDGGIDCAVLCAGLTADAPLATMTSQQWQAVIDTNLTGTKNMLVEAARRMPQGGNILLIGSIRGFTGNRGQANYAASKAGLTGLMRSAARELAEQNIRINLVLPGIIPSKMTESADMTAAINENCLGRVNTMDEIVKTIVFLSGLENVSGQTFNLDSRIF